MHGWATGRGAGALARSGVVVLLVAGCSGDDAPPTSTTLRPGLITTPPASTVPDDGVLRIGLLLPRSGPGAEFGKALETAAQVAASEVNAAGGVRGRRIDLLGRDEGSDAATASLGLSELVDAGADVIVGPASSTIALGVLRQAIDADRVVCSPTATAIALSDFPDSGRFMRTIPSDALQAEALAELISRSGRRTAGILYPDDEFGEGFEQNLATELAARGIGFSSATAYDPDAEDLSQAVAVAATGEPEMLVVVGEPSSGSRLLDAVGERSDPLTPVFVNDALRRTTLSESAKPSTRSLLARTSGVSPLASPPAGPFLEAMVAGDPTGPTNYAAYAHDCVVLAALAAVSVGTDDAFGLAAAMIEISGQGVRCTDFAECAGQLTSGFNVDFDGPSGRIEFDVTGDVTSATFERFTFDDTGRDVPAGRITVNP